MSESRKTVLVVGATGSIGHLVMEEAVRQRYVVRAMVRTPSKARQFPAQVEVISGDVTRPETLTAAVDGIHAIVFTLGSDGAGKVGAETVDYGGVRNVLAALGSRTARIALMTSIGVTNRTGSYNRSTESHDWKRRAERLVRASSCRHRSPTVNAEWKTHEARAQKARAARQSRPLAAVARRRTASLRGSKPVDRVAVLSLGVLGRKRWPSIRSFATRRSRRLAAH